eukprot:gene5343-5396_t
MDDAPGMTQADLESLARARALREAGRLEEAEAVAGALLLAHPDAVAVAKECGHIALWQRNWAVAVRCWQEVQRLDPDDFDGLFHEARALADSGQTETADERYRKLILRNPDSFWAHHDYARAAMVTRQWDVALERWRRLQALFANEPAGYVGEIEALRAAGELDAAQLRLSQFAERFPDDVAAASEQAELALQRHDRVAALAAMGRLVALPGQAQARLGPPIVGTILSHDPLIVHAATYHVGDLVRSVMRLYGDVRSPVYFLLNSNMSLVFNNHLREQIVRELVEIGAAFADARVTFLANDVEELLLAQSILACDCRLISNNAFVDTAIFTIRPDAEKRFDAIYNARYLPYKRHELARLVPNLCLVTADVTADLVDTIRAALPLATVVGRHVSPEEVVDLVNASRCSLCLSAAEGAMYASIESLLCGVPIVTTRSIGGRDWFFSNDVVVYVDDDPAAVALAVDALGARAIDPAFIRRGALERIRRERLAFFDIVDGIYASHGQPQRRFAVEFETLFHDKMNYRNRLLSELLFDPTQR